MVRAETDEQVSIEAKEFLWNSNGLSEAHEYVLPTLKQWLARAGARRVLDIGCGNGALSAELCNEGLEVVGTEISQSGIALARKLYPRIPFFLTGVESPLPQELAGRFDAVISVEVIEHLLLPRSLFQRAKEALRPGGTLIVTTPFHGFVKNVALALSNKFDQHWHPLRDHGHVKFFSLATLSQLFQEQDFEVRSTARLGRIPPLARSMMVEGTFRPLSPGE